MSHHREGDPVIGQTCPKCKRESVVYNGNYFCVACPWTMGERGLPKRIVKAYLIQRLLAAQASGNTREEARITHYIIKLGFVDEVVSG